MIPNDLKYPTTVVAKYGHNKVLNKPFDLYDFGYYNHYGCVVYQHGERNFQDSCAFKLEQVRVATEEDKEILLGKLIWKK